MTTTEVVEDVLRGYVPPAEPKPVGALVRRGPILVLPAKGVRRISLAEAAAALLDSNVIIAIVAEAHEHHTMSLELVTAGDAANYDVSLHRR